MNILSQQQYQQDMNILSQQQYQQNLWNPYYSNTIDNFHHTINTPLTEVHPQSSTSLQNNEKTKETNTKKRKRNQETNL